MDLIASSSDALSRAVGAASAAVAGAAELLLPPIASAAQQQPPFTEDTLRHIVYQLAKTDAR